MAATELTTWDLAEGDALTADLTVLRHLGGGTHHEALLVWDERRLAVLVAKALRPADVEDPDSRLMLEREAEALRAIDHPVVVRLFDAVLDGERPHLLLEHLEGATLRSVMRRTGPLALEQLLPLGLHLAAALHHLHGLGRVHLDVKPDNVVLGAPPRLIDFSVCATLERAARMRGAVGTDATMAPEQCVPDGRIGPASDVFGLGATLHWAWAGERPWPREDGAREAADPAVRWPQLVAPPEPLPGRTPPALAGLVDAMLDPEPDARPSMHEVAEGLEPLVAELPDRLVLTGRGLRPGRRRQRRST
jgi:eukaryotic-like serine/threonine-protein kinase